MALIPSMAFQVISCTAARKENLVSKYRFTKHLLCAGRYLWGSMYISHLMPTANL